MAASPAWHAAISNASKGCYYAVTVTVLHRNPETAIKKVWDSAEFKEFMNRRGFDMIYLDSAGFAEFMKADDEDNGKALKSLGLAK